MLKILKNLIFGRMITPIADGRVQGIHHTLVPGEYLTNFPDNLLEFNENTEII